MGSRLSRTLACGALVPALIACEPEEPISHTVIPNPTSVQPMLSDTFDLSPETTLTVDPGDGEAMRIAGVLADLIASFEQKPVIVETTGDPSPGTIFLTSRGADPALGPEGYQLSVRSAGVTLSAPTSAGLFYGAQTIRQLLPADVEYTAAFPQPLHLTGIDIEDAPRFAWRGVMLDVSRHFLTAMEVKRFVDWMALYKLNRLHLHLSDDQGWRIAIPGWPNLTEHGGSTEVGGGPGGYYTTEEYADLVRYAEERFITVVPEIDLPGHTNAALASYPELNCDGVAPELYTGIRVGFSSLCTEHEITYTFVEDVVREISALTPGPYFHVGGDEVETLTPDQYDQFIARVQDIVESQGKRMIGWDEIAQSTLNEGTIIQLWRPLWRPSDAPEPSPEFAAAATELRDGLESALMRGASVILSPADRLYLDMKYDSTSVLGLSWAGLIDPRSVYDWEPTRLFNAIPETSIEGIEAPLWSETLGTLDDFEYMAFPRLAGVAELGWSALGTRRWSEFRGRLGAQAPRWTVLGINFRRWPDIPWIEGPP